MPYSLNFIQLHDRKEYPALCADPGSFSKIFFLVYCYEKFNALKISILSSRFDLHWRATDCRTNGYVFFCLCLFVVVVFVVVFVVVVC